MTAPRSPQPDPTPHVHDQRYDGDDPYLVCHGCGQRWDALTGLPLNVWAGPQDSLPTSPDPSEAAVTDRDEALRDIRYEVMSGSSPALIVQMIDALRAEPSAPERPDQVDALFGVAAPERPDLTERIEAALREDARWPYDQGLVIDMPTVSDAFDAGVEAARQPVRAALRAEQAERPSLDVADDPVECGICGDYTVKGVEVHEVCLDMLSRSVPSSSESARHG